MSYLTTQSVNPPTIFVIDDHSDIRLALQWLLEAELFHVEAFASAQSFLDSYEPNKSGCIVTDMHAGNGWIEISRAFESGKYSFAGYYAHRLWRCSYGS